MKEVCSPFKRIRLAVILDSIMSCSSGKELGLNLNLVQETLNTLAEAGYVQVEAVETLAGKKYMVSLTAKGEAALEVFV